MCVMVDGFSTHPKLDEDFCHETYYNIEECLQTFPHVDESYIYSISTFCEENGGQLYMVDSPQAEKGTGIDQKLFLHKIYTYYIFICSSLVIDETSWSQ